MNILIRDHRPEDAKQIADVYRDSYGGLRVSKGGQHPDSMVDKEISKSDEELFSYLKSDSSLVVAEVQETNEIVGFGALKFNFLNSLIKSAYSKSHYVKKTYQGGKKGVSVGRLLRQATIDKAKKLGFRKIYGYTLEAVAFHKKFGAVFYPAYNSPPNDYGISLNYYEIILQKSFWNKFHVEPYFSELSSLAKLYVMMLKKFRKKS